MASDNHISLDLTPEKQAALAAATAALKAEADGHIVNLTLEERQTLPKIADKTLAFDEKCKGYMASRPDLIPGFVNSEELLKDRTVIETYRPLWRELKPICDGIEDTISLAYTDVYTADLAFYHSVKQAAKRGVAGAQAIYDDLKERFPGRRRADETQAADA